MSIRAVLLVERCRVFQVDVLPVATNDASANLLRCLLQLRLTVRVIKLFQAGTAMGGMCALITGAKAFVSHAVAIAVTGKLVEDVGDFFGQVVGVDLVRMLEAVAPALVLGQDRRKFVSSRTEDWN